MELVLPSTIIAVVSSMQPVSLCFTFSQIATARAEIWDVRVEQWVKEDEVERDAYNTDERSKESIIYEQQLCRQHII